MDTDTQYIEMCRQAKKEIQDKWIPKVGDWCVDMGDIWILSNENVDYVASLQANDTWLPRQDQLQEILEFPVGCFNDNFWSALGNLDKFAFGHSFPIYIPLTMEQLWLVYVMYERFGKNWDGEKWVSIELGDK